MKPYVEYYEKKLYPIQDGIMQLMSKITTPFYLTDGTALSRYYFNHRYSDDLDFFLNNDTDFLQYAKILIAALQSFSKTNNLYFDSRKVKLSETFCQCYVANDDVSLKIDLVNGLPYRFGDSIKIVGNFAVDNLRNILSNKITAIFRHEPKDLVDIWVISKNYIFNWEEIFYEAKEKELGINPILIAEILTTFPSAKLNEISWIAEYDYEKITTNIKQLVDDILKGSDNSLAKTKINLTEAKPINNLYK